MLRSKNKVLAFVLLAVFCHLTQSVHANELTIYLNKGEVLLQDELISVAAFNTTDVVNSKNTIIPLEIGEELVLTVVNTDTLEHTLTIDEYLETDNILPAQGEATFTLSFENAGTFRYYSDRSYGKLIGASGMIHVGLSDLSVFSWNLFDLNKTHTFELANANATSMPEAYQPELFLINGLFFPETLDDADALVNVELNESAYISVVNSGYMDHVMHFHGFHVEIISSQMHPERVGWSKDTVPVKSGDAMTFRLVANIEGVYPVHDHNLIAVTNTGFYPGGMITQIHVGQ